MRDAFGGVFMMRLMLVFIVIYVAFTAISFKYAKSFRIKNNVIDFIEQNQIIDINAYFNRGNQPGLAKLNQALSKANYNITCEEIGYSEGDIVDDDTQKNLGYCYHGIVIKKDTIKSNEKTIYYTVNSYANWNLGVLNTILALGGKDPNSEGRMGGRWKISGDAIVNIK